MVGPQEEGKGIECLGEVTGRQNRDVMIMVYLL